MQGEDRCRIEFGIGYRYLHDLLYSVVSTSSKETRWRIHTLAVNVGVEQTKNELEVRLLSGTDAS